MTLSACGGGDSAETDANAVDTLAVNNLIVDEGAAMTANIDANGTADLNAAETNDLVNQDLTTNNPDANLANGL